jgi:hypothetical protein
MQTLDRNSALAAVFPVTTSAGSLQTAQDRLEGRAISPSWVMQIYGYASPADYRNLELLGTCLEITNTLPAILCVHIYVLVSGVSLSTRRIIGSAVILPHSERDMDLHEIGK